MKYTTTKHYLYKHGLPIPSVLANTLKQQKERVDNKKASLIIIDGQQGEGKTTLLVHCIDYINSLYGLKPCKISLLEHPQLAMGGKDFIKQLRICEKQKIVALGYDEAGDFNKRGAMGRLNSVLINVFQKFRGFKIIIILALPNFVILDNYLFDLGIPRLLIHCEKRKSYGNFKAYSLSQMNWIRYWFEKLPKGAKNLCYDKALPNYRGHFLNLPPEREAALDRLSTKSKVKGLIDEEIKIEGLLSYTELSNKVGRSVIWVRKKIADLNLKHDRIIDRQKFFKKETLDILTDYLDELREKKVK